jgi:hypothetical protein
MRCAAVVIAASERTPMSRADMQDVALGHPRQRQQTIREMRTMRRIRSFSVKPVTRHTRCMRVVLSRCN